MEQKKWLSNEINLAFRQTLNDNVDTANRNQQQTNQRIQENSSRIENIILAHQDNNHYEVVDARVGRTGKVHATLKARLDSEQAEMSTSTSALQAALEQLQASHGQLSERVNQLTGDLSRNLNVFVSTGGHDSTGDGSEQKPFRTIQRAVNSIPLINAGTVTIEIESGTYLEDIKVIGFKAQSFELRAGNFGLSDPSAGNTDVFVRSIAFIDCQGYCKAAGLTFTDVRNTDNIVNVDVPKQVGALFLRCTYGALEFCRFAENTRSTEYAAVMVNGGMGSIYRNHFQNQETAIESVYMASTRVTSSNTGTGNNLVLRCNSAIVFASGVVITGTTARQSVSAGQIFTASSS